MTLSNTKISKILIANRGEIAVRIIKTAKHLGIESVAVYSEVDSEAMHVKLADEAYCIGPANATESYLNISKLLKVATQSQCDAVHPGYGFLSENAEFAAACIKAKIIFIGPDESALKLMGSKSESKEFARNNQIPVIPGEENPEQTKSAFEKIAKTIGYPLLVKASAGGGGKGMKLVNKAEDLGSAFDSAKREALSGFGNDYLLIEKYFEKARHIEVQVLADQVGNVIHLYDRDCSLQRRHQKVIEEAPAQNLKAETREKMQACAISLCKKINYQGAGTIEFLVDDEENFYFMEMNTRLQVEHAVTEQVTGIDLVEEQINIAKGLALSYQQNDVSVNGHSIEARIYAEQAFNQFLPASGFVRLLEQPQESEFIRLDSAMQEGDEVSTYYDPMIAKVVSLGESRQDAIRKIDKALQSLKILGLDHNRDFLVNCLRHTDFINNNCDTRFIEQQIAELGKHQISESTRKHLSLIACATKHLIDQSQQKNNTQALNQSQAAWFQSSNWRLNQQHQFQQAISFSNDLSSLNYKLEATGENQITISGLISDTPQSLSITMLNESHFSCLLDGQLFKFLALKTCKPDLDKINIASAMGHFEVLLPHKKLARKASNKLVNLASKAPLNGRVISINAKNGDSVKLGQDIVVLEAMKMEHSVKASSDGKIEKLKLSEGDLVEADQVLFSILPNATDDKPSSKDE